MQLDDRKKIDKDYGDMLNELADDEREFFYGWIKEKESGKDDVSDRGRGED